MEDNQVPEVTDEKLQETRRRLIDRLISDFDTSRGLTTKAVDKAIESGLPVMQYAETNDGWDKLVDLIYDKQEWWN